MDKEAYDRIMRTRERLNRDNMLSRSGILTFNPHKVRYEVKGTLKKMYAAVQAKRVLGR